MEIDKTLTAQMVLEAANYRARGFRRWDINDDFQLYYMAADDDWINGIMGYHGWLGHVTIEKDFIPIKINRMEAWMILVEKYGVWND